jgi:hypothetical protein
MRSGTVRRREKPELPVSLLVDPAVGNEQLTAQHLYELAHTLLGRLDVISKLDPESVHNLSDRLRSIKQLPSVAADHIQPDAPGGHLEEEPIDEIPKPRCLRQRAMDHDTAL